jgi:hypothetical protein
VFIVFLFIFYDVVKKLNSLAAGNGVEAVDGGRQWRQIVAANNGSDVGRHLVDDDTKV